MIKSEIANNPRTFKLGDHNMKDHGKIILTSDEPGTNEILTVVTKDGKECDITATEWGFYLGSSLNHRLKSQGFKAALVANDTSQLYLMAVEKEKLAQFESYIAKQGSRIVAWLDDWSEGKEIKSKWTADNE